MVSSPRRLASSKARTRLSELPLVDRPTAMSPGRPKAASWRANTTSKPTSLARAVTTATSSVSDSAGRARPPGRGCRKVVATACVDQGHADLLGALAGVDHGQVGVEQLDHPHLDRLVGAGDADVAVTV